jgi:EAL domain-containing protein (putative c-di-GMP-specific phosphodiesterase class I)
MTVIVVSESTVMSDLAHTLDVLARLGEQGICVSLDDYGTGSSLLTHLKRRELGLHVVAEGVETAQQWDQLRSWGCHTAQGYYLSRPLPAEQFRSWLIARPSGHMAPQL